MKRKKVLAVSVCLVVILSGCGLGDEIPKYTVKHDEGAEPWGLQDAMVTSVSNVLEEQQEMIAPVLHEVELEADILGIYETSGDVEGERKIVTSQLTAGKEYEVTARILLSANAEAILGQELDFLLELPTVVEKGKKSTLGIAVFAGGVAMMRNEFAVTAPAHDLCLGYVPGTYSVTMNGMCIEPTPGDVLWNEDMAQQGQSLDYLTRVDRQLGVCEYILSYRVQTEILDAQDSAVAMQMAEPISIRLEGISHQYADARDKASALLALNDCLRDNYLMQETILCEGTVYMAVEVFLPDWAREYASQHGLAVTWYNYSTAPGCGIGVSLPMFPDNLGHVEASFENLRLTPLVGEGTENTVGALMPYPMTPLSIWAKKENEVFLLENLAFTEMPTEMTEELRMGRSSTTQLLGGEIIEKLPASGRFYVVLGTDLICVESDVSEE